MRAKTKIDWIRDGVPWLSLGLAVLLGRLAGERAETLGAALLLTGILFNGLPHGAFDFFVMRRQSAAAASGARRRHAKLLARLAVYVALAALTAALWLWQPEISLVLFLLVTAWHFGSGDTLAVSRTAGEWICNGFGRGLILIGAPVYFHFEQSAAVFRSMTASGNGIFWNWLETAMFFSLVGGLLLQSAGSFLAARRGSNSNETAKWLETVFLLAAFWLTSPLLTLTCYFIGVHSWRHILRFGTAETGEAVDLRRVLWDFHRETLPIVAISLVGLALIFWLQPFRLENLAEWTSAYLILLSALTVPHVLLVTSVDAREF